MLVFGLTAHEYAHAATALHEGDDTAYLLGRVTLNPIPHIDPWMSLLLPALLWFGTDGRFTFGGAKPVPVNSRKYRHYVRGDILVSAAGVTVNFFLALLWSLCFILLGLLSRAVPGGAEVLETAQRMMLHGIWLNLVLCFFNLIPLPPLLSCAAAEGGDVVSRAPALRVSSAVRPHVPVPAGDVVPAHAGIRDAQCALRRDRPLSGPVLREPPVR
jgi:hypothetical protein